MGTGSSRTRLSQKFRLFEHKTMLTLAMPATQDNAVLLSHLGKSPSDFYDQHVSLKFVLSA